MAQVAPASTSQRARQREETRDRIFQAAVAEFRRVGFHEAQIPRIAEAAGVVRGTFYFHFPNKDHVLDELANRLQAEIAGAVHALAGRAVSFGALLSGLVDAIAEVDESLSEGDLIRDVVNAHVRARSEDAPGPITTDLLDELVVQIGRAIERGELRSNLAPEPVAATLLTSIFGIMASPRTPDRSRRTELELLVALLMEGMLPRD